MYNYYTLQHEIEQHSDQLRQEAEAHRLSQTRAQDIDTRSVRAYSTYLVKVMNRRTNR